MNKLRQSVLQGLLLSGCVLAMPSVVLAQGAASSPQSDPSGVNDQSSQNDSQSGAKQAKKGRDATKLGTITVTGNTVNKLAPSAAPLDAIQPTSVIDEQFIRDSLRLDANYSDIIKYSPSVSVTAPEGPGLGKMEGTSIRGFQDGQFNVTFDGIPFGNQTNLHHSTSAYFTNHVLGQAQIDRGPGGAATIGNATFGGTLGLRSRNPSATPGVTPYLSIGSWNYRSAGVSADGKLGAKTSIFADVSKSSADTFLKGTDDRSKHAFVKTVSELGKSTTMTFVSSYNQEHQNTIQGATKAQIAKYGPRFGLGNDPTVQNYKGYNGAAYYSSFTYLGLSTSVGDWDFENKVYYVTFTHASDKAGDATDMDPDNNKVTYYDAAGNKVKTLKGSDVGGKYSSSSFHAFGDVFHARRYIGDNVLKFGFWAERDIGGKWSTPKNLTTGELTGYKYGSIYKYYYDETDSTFQPYVEFDWALNDWLTLAPGLKYTQTTRNMNAQFLHHGNKGKPSYTSAKYSATMPSLSLHARFTDHWTGYVQLAKGFLAPPVDVIEVSGSKSLDPESTTNFQIGTAYATSKFTYGANIYYIDFSNLLTETEVSTDIGKEDTFINSGGAIYSGAEFEATYGITRTLSLYGNASYNKATYKHSNVQIAQAPKVTASLGLLYNNDKGFYSSIMSKFTGQQYGLDNTTDSNGDSMFANGERMAGFLAVDATVGFRSKDGGFSGKGYSIALNINNVFNVHKLSSYAGTQDATDAPLYFGLAGRGFFIDMSMKF